MPTIGRLFRPTTPLRQLLSVATAFLTLLLASGTVSAREALPADGTPIAEVRVEGTERLTEREVLRRMEMREGGQFSREAYRRDFQAIANIGTIDPLALRIAWEERAADNALVIVVHITENPVINDIRFIGNQRFTARQLMNELEYEVGDMVPVNVEAATARNLRSFYRAGGYRASTINVMVDPVEEDAGRVNITISIDEGARIRIRRTIYRGNSHFSSFHLNQRLTNAPGILFFRNYYDETFLEDDMATLRTMYRDAGYLDASVQRGDLIYNEEKAEITIVFDIEEGPRYRVSEAVTEGVSYFTEPEVRDLVRPLEDRVFKGRRLARAMDRLRKLYGDQGYIDTEVGYRLDRNREAQTVRVILQVRESPAVYVGEISLDMEDYTFQIELNALERMMDRVAPPTKPETVMREVRLKTGEKFRTSDEARTVERLRNLGIFRRVNVVREPTTDPQVRDAVIRVEEDPAAAFIGVSAGVGEQSGPSVTFRFEHPNVGGRADRLSASATFGTRNIGYRLQFFKRYLGDSDVSMDTRLYYLTDRYRAYRERTLGGSVEFGKPLSEHLQGYLRFRLERVSFPNSSKEADEDFDSYYVIAARPLLVYDQRDNVFYPTRGYLLSGGIEVGAADGFLFKMLHAYEWYKQPFERSEVVYAYEHTVGLMPYDATNIGLSERFFMGGSGNLRGFRAREVGPRDSGDDDLVIGGATRITQRHEIRFPIAEDFLKGRVFTDIGILEKGPFELGTPRIGSGVGTMIDLGPVRAEVDFAVPVLKESGDQAQFFHLRIGSRF